MGNTRPSTPGSRYAPPALRAPHPRGRVAVFTTLVATARAVTLRFTPLAGLRYARRAPLRGPRYVLRTRAALDVRGSPPPSLRSSPARRLHIWVTFGYGICCGCLRYDTGPVSAALRPREPASLLCAIKRLSLLGGWINYLPDFQLRDPYSRFVDSSQHLIQRRTIKLV